MGRTSLFRAVEFESLEIAHPVKLTLQQLGNFVVPGTLRHIDGGETGFIFDLQQRLSLWKNASSSEAEDDFLHQFQLTRLRRAVQRSTAVVIEIEVAVAREGSIRGGRRVDTAVWIPGVRAE